MVMVDGVGRSSTPQPSCSSCSWMPVRFARKNELYAVGCRVVLRPGIQRRGRIGAGAVSRVTAADFKRCLRRVRSPEGFQEWISTEDLSPANCEPQAMVPLLFDMETDENRVIEQQEAGSQAAVAAAAVIAVVVELQLPAFGSWVGESCSVCYDELKRGDLVQTSCGHWFCESCLERALEHRPTCPLCRTQLRASRPRNSAIYVDIIEALMSFYADNQSASPELNQHNRVQMLLDIRALHDFARILESVHSGAASPPTSSSPPTFGILPSPPAFALTIVTM